MELRDIAEAEAYLDGFINRERTGSFDYERLGLERIRALCAEIGNPEAKLPCVHITGSKGKGTTAYATEALLRAAGLRVGTYTSPHLVSWRERFRIDGEPVSAATLVRVLSAMLPATERLRSDPELCPSFFDVTTALALALFRDACVDVGVIEVGIGGRIDSTNVVASRVSVLTCVQLEHTDKLGDTLEAIAREKVGILRPGVPFLHGPLDPEAYGAVAARAVAEDAPLEAVAARVLEAGTEGLRLALDDGRELGSPVLGRHQVHNLALAVRAAERFLGRELAAEELGALDRLQLPARVERLGDLILDSAHSPDSARALRRALLESWPGRSWVWVASIARDKDAAGLLAELAEPVRACVLTRSEPTRSIDPAELEPLAWACGIEIVECEPNPHAALARARALAAPGEGIVVAGSVYLAGLLRPELVRAAEAATR